MSTLLKTLLTAPTFEDPEKAQTASVLNVILQTALYVVLGLFVYTLLFRDPQAVELQGYIAFISTSTLFFIAFLLFRQGNLIAPTLILLSTIHIAVSFGIIQGDGVRSNLVVVYIINIIIAGLVIGRQALLGFILLSTVTVLGLYYAETQQLINQDAREEIQVFDLLIVVSLTGFATYMFYLLFRIYTKNLERTQENERALVESNRQLQAIRMSLEDRVVARTRRMETLTTLNEYLSTILNRDQLLDTLIEALTKRLGYDHALIFFYDEAHESLVLAQSNNLPGSVRLSDDQTSPVTHSTLAERAAIEGRAKVGGLETSDLDWQPPAILPQAKSEIAVPILLDGIVVGVLDVLDDQPDKLDESDVNVLRSLANQISGSLRNARLFADLEIALKEANAAQSRYQAQAWASIRSVSHDLEHLAVAPTAVLPDMDVTQSIDEARQMVFSHTEPTVVSPKQGGKEILVAPIKLQRNIIGALQIHSQEGNQQWNEDDLKIIETILDQFSQAAENLRLSDSNLKQANREQVIRQITEKMRMATNLETLVEVAASELGEQLGAAHAIVELGAEKEQDAMQRIGD